MLVKVIKKSTNTWFDEEIINKTGEVIKTHEEHYRVEVKDFDKNGSLIQWIPKECCEVVEE